MRETQELEKIKQELKPGSGKIWKNQLTKPQVPRLSHLMDECNADLANPQIIKKSHRIKALERPITANFASMSTNSKRHNVYRLEDEIKQKLKESGHLLNHYMHSLTRSGAEPTILDELAHEQIYKPSIQTLPEYKQEVTMTQRQRSNLRKSESLINESYNYF